MVATAVMAVMAVVVDLVDLAVVIDLPHMTIFAPVKVVLEEKEATAVLAVKDNLVLTVKPIK